MAIKAFHRPAEVTFTEPPFERRPEQVRELARLAEAVADMSSVYEQVAAGVRWQRRFDSSATSNEQHEAPQTGVRA